MREATAQCIRDAFCRESVAHVRYLIYADKATEEHFPAIARLFRAFALSKYLMASGYYHLVNELIGVYPAFAATHYTLNRTMDNLERSRDAEAETAKGAFEPYLAVARLQKEKGAEKSLKCSIEVCRDASTVMGDVLQKTRHAAEEPQIGELYVCRVCGYVKEGKPSGQCTVCVGSKAGFILVK